MSRSVALPVRSRVRFCLHSIAAWSSLFCPLVMGALPAAAQGMALSGKFGVSATGAATYSIPIALPPSTAGMIPSLSLTYSSQHGNGVFGVGWTLDGLPSIGRCSPTLAQDGVAGAIGYDANDRFCLDGHRLIAISGAYGADGTEYRTEIESFAKIISHGTAGTGPAWFEVWTKSGQRLEFGNTADSRILAQGKTTARAWAVNNVSDTKGNYFAVTYWPDFASGQVYLSNITYTGNASAGVAPYNSVWFIHEVRPDLLYAYEAGSQTLVGARVANIQTFSGAKLVTDYRLAYEQGPGTNRSRITSITACAGDGTCLPATSLSWTSGGTGEFLPMYQTVAGDYGIPLTKWWAPLGGDFNGDGKSDFLFLTANEIHTFLSNGDGTKFTAVAQSITGNYGTPPSPEWMPIVGDFNGDGKTDFLFYGATTYWIYLSKGDGSFTESPHALPYNYGTPNSYWTPIVGDFNGDGKTDFLLLTANAIHAFFSVGNGTFILSLQTIVLNFGTPPTTSWTPISGDFNGDGKSDFLFIAGSSSAAFLNKGDGTFTVVTQALQGLNFGMPPTATWTPIGGDFNGDGKSDFLFIAGSNIGTFLSKGDGTFAVVGQALEGLNFGVPPSAGWTPISGDFNGDGKSDFVFLTGSSLVKFLSKGDGTFAPVGQSLGSLNFGVPPTAWTPIGGDFDGDGKSDFLLFAADGYFALLCQGGQPDLLASLTNGLGANVAIAYMPLTNASVYTKEATAVYPAIDLQAPAYVVSRVDASNGIGGTVSATYRYAGAKADQWGRGLLGFRQRTVTDLQTGIVQTTTFRQDFPFLGLVANEIRTLGAKKLNETTNSYQLINASGGTIVGPGKAPYRGLLMQSVAGSTDLDGTVLPTVTSTYQYDTFGNATQITIATSDGYSRTTTSTYTNNTVSWLLGRLTTASVVSTSP